MNMLVDIPTLSKVPNLDKQVYLLGLDFGSTTSSALIASAQISRSATGRMQFSEINIVFRSEPVFTPFKNGMIDLPNVSKLIHSWLTQSKVGVHQLFSGGSIITGLAAQADNASGLQSLIKEIVGDSVIATADDPCLESWLAFMGCSASLSRYYANEVILNLDIGGGTTNAALGLNGDVQATGCYFIGARHFQFVPGSYQLVAISSYGQALLVDLKIQKQLGDSLNEDEYANIVSYYVNALEAIAQNHTDFFQSKIAKMHQQVALNIHQHTKPKVTFSGGVGELLYQCISGVELPSTTYFGDLGIDLARAIAQSPILSADLQTFIPENKGRATVYGLTLHNTEISGHTLFLPRPDVLPLSNLPIVAKLSLNMPNEQWQSAFKLASSRKQGACIQIINLASPNLADMRNLANMIQAHFVSCLYPANQPLVILVEANIGKALGQYCSKWGEIMHNLIVIDEVPLRHAQFLHIGRLHQQMLPVSFFGMH
jgi:ethanolamine utilization protein EutA